MYNTISLYNTALYYMTHQSQHFCASDKGQNKLDFTGENIEQHDIVVGG